ncbi:hypothetical protein Cflav_PD5695 [Pedosphaera parvula Ellin514]|uniref:Uncharacterized protein n=1 Tax=Pedosphaera parvula (strain Ellin514) TaxID=320771 RepID=B9XAM5_PEDPL|nr:hypothetical protein Cflav_PD5695 [Pedosphaera parvula Ellin514]
MPATVITFHLFPAFWEANQQDEFKADSTSEKEISQQVA